jgi:hypothetical protein
MMNWFSRDTGPSDELGRDMVLAEALSALDPATEDPNYWFRFRGWVMSGAARELARRRLMADLTVGDVLTSWARTVVPTAVAAAAVAAFVLVRAGAAVPQVAQEPLGLEELLVSDLSNESVSVLLTPDAASGLVAFASEIF